MIVLSKIGPYREAVLVPDTVVRRNRELPDNRGDKHDLKDAANVVDLISQDKFQYYEHPRIEIRELLFLLVSNPMKQRNQTPCDHKHNRQKAPWPYIF